MRDIKFRAWNAKYNIMVEVGAIDFIEETVVLGSFEYPLDKFPIMQYTGLKDKNGKGIYEGDILHVKESLSNFVYNHTNGTITSNSWENNFKHVVKFSPSGLQLVSYFVNQHECEVVGDIYTNPELLGEVRE